MSKTDKEQSKLAREVSESIMKDREWTFNYIHENAGVDDDAMYEISEALRIPLRLDGKAPCRSWAE